MKKYYFPYEYQFDIGKNQLEKQYFSFYIFYLQTL